MRSAISSVIACAILAQGVSSMQERREAVVADGLIYVSGLAGTGEDGKLAGPDVSAQTRRTLERLSHVLEAAGSSLAQAVNVSVYLAHAQDFEAMNAVYREFFPDKPPARTTVAVALQDDALVQISAIAVPNGAPRETLLPAGWMKSPRPYSYIVRAGDLVFLSGLVSRRGTDDQVVIGPVHLQMATILDNARTLLKTAGLTLTDVVSARVFVTDDSFFDEMNAAYASYFPTEPPARATAVTGLMGSDAKVEVSLIASVGPKETIGPLLSPTLPVSTAIRAGRRVFLAGVLGNTDANLDDAAAQTRETLTRIGRTLQSAGLSFADVVDSTVYLPDLSQYSKMNDVYRAFFPKDPPARTTAGARLIARRALVEMMLTAVR